MRSCRPVVFARARIYAGVMAAPIIVDRRTGLSPEEFRREYRDRRRPVVMTDATRQWLGHRVITPDWLRSAFPDKEVALLGHERRWRVPELVDLLADPESDSPYPCCALLDVEWPELAPMFQPLPIAHATPNRLSHKAFLGGRFGSRTEIFLGGPKGHFPYAHIDYYHLSAWINMVYGEKEFWVFSVDDDAQMYPKPPDNWQSEVDAFDPDLERHPRFANVEITKIRMGPGETLYIPAGTWHTARSLGQTLSVAFDQLDHTNMDRFVQDVRTYRERGLSRRIAYSSYLGVMGRVADVVERMPLPRHPW